MKWLFAVLVALNIIVFGGMVAGRVAEKQKTVVVPTVPVVDNSQHELNLPAAAISGRPSETSAPDWVGAANTNPAASEPVDDELLLAEAARKAKEQQQKEHAEKEAREPAAKEQVQQSRTEEDKEKGSDKKTKEEQAAVVKTDNQCVANATATLDEDDYHRIKGLLQRWPHAASRTVEKRGEAKKSAAQAQKTYRVLVASGGDMMAQLDSLAAKGFSGTIYEGDISVGVTRSKSAAQVLISRLATAGFGGTRIHEQEDRSSAADNALSVAKMQLTFMQVDDKNAQAIQTVLERYGKLNRKACR